MLSCKEVSTAVASDRLEQSGRWQRFQTRLHLLMCRHCRTYAAQIRAIGTAARRLFGEDRVDPDALARMEESILGSLPRRGADADKRR